ncbi:MAG: 2'-5' RNA ligase family protein [Spirochaetales bacterium]|nr:2'-5' RNA ligase family protein [Spirochaetales bacterium]
MNEKIIRFIIITTPPKQIQDEINVLRYEISRIGDCREALNYPPHITLRTGALVPENETPVYFKLFDKHIKELKPFSITTQGIDGGIYQSQGESKHYFYYRINLTPELVEFHKRLLSFELYKKQEQTYYSPHLTLAFEDLSDEKYKEVKQYLGEKMQSARNYYW